jgi:RNA polymerase sigma factor (sigma-70 family)
MHTIPQSRSEFMDSIGLHSLIKKVAEKDFREYEIKFAEIFDGLVHFVGYWFLEFDGPTCEAVAQQTMWIILDKASTYRGETDSNGRAWILTIAHNHAKSVAVREKRHVSLDSDFENISEEDQDSRVEREDTPTVTEQDWINIKASLTVRQLEVFSEYLKGCKFTTIAKNLHISKSRVTQIFTQIKEKISVYFESKNRPSPGSM